jgi:hypothetical protein
MPARGRVSGLEPLEGRCARGGRQIDRESVTPSQVRQVKPLSQDRIGCSQLEGNAPATCLDLSDLQAAAVEVERTADRPIEPVVGVDVKQARREIDIDLQVDMFDPALRRVGVGVWIARRRTSFRLWSAIEFASRAPCTLARDAGQCKLPRWEPMNGEEGRPERPTTGRAVGRVASPRRTARHCAQAHPS